MKSDVLARRLESLEALRSPENGQPREFLGKLTDNELYRLKEICIRTRNWELKPTDEEESFILNLGVKYGFTWETKQT